MNNIFKGLLAGYGAHKLGGGCIGTIVVFVIIWVLLGHCWNALNYYKICRDQIAKTVKKQLTAII